MPRGAGKEPLGDGFWDAPPIHLSNSACPFCISYDGKALHPTVAWLPRGAASGAGAGAWPSQGQHAPSPCCKAPHPARNVLTGVQSSL